MEIDINLQVTYPAMVNLCYRNSKTPDSRPHTYLNGSLSCSEEERMILETVFHVDEAGRGGGDGI